MKPNSDTQDTLMSAGDLDEKVLESAAKPDGTSLAPETSAGTANITVWDEPAEAAGQRVPELPTEGDETIAEQLVRAGSEEADREQRVASELEEQSKPV